MLSLFAYIRNVSDTSDTFVIDVPGRFAPNIPNPVWDAEGLLFKTTAVQPQYSNSSYPVQVLMKKDGSGAWSLYVRASSNGGAGHISLMNFVPCGGYEEVAS